MLPLVKGQGMKNAILIAIIALLAITSVNALQQITVARGQGVTLDIDTGARGVYFETGAQYSIPEIGFANVVKDTNPQSAIITQTLQFDIPAGNYVLQIDTEVDQQQTRHEEIALTITDSQNTVLQTNSTISMPQAPVEPSAQISIPAIPDLEAGETFVVPVTITGNGVYEIQIPKLDYATYEVPSQITVNGQTTIPVLVHINTNAKPGTYVLEASAGGDSASTRIRIIEYTTRNNNISGILFGVGILLILAGVLLIAFFFIRGKGSEPRPKKPTDNSPEELITYY